MSAVLAIAWCMGAAAPVPDAYAIYDQARHVWSAQQYPPFLGYTIAVNVVENGVAKSRHYHLTYDAQSGAIDVDPVSDEERAAPPDPNGVVIHLQPKRQHQVLVDKRVGNPGEAVDFLGVPKIAPTYAFGLSTGSEVAGAPSPDDLVADIRKEFNDPEPAAKAQAEAAAEPLKTIAVVSTKTRAYTIENAGLESVDGYECWHLVLRPNGDPRKLRLRALWVDRDTYKTRQLLASDNFVGSGTPWLVTFAEVGGAMYIDTESALAPVTVGDHRYQKAVVSFQQVAPAERPVHAANFFTTKENILSEPGDGNLP